MPAKQMLLYAYEFDTKEAAISLVDKLSTNEMSALLFSQAIYRVKNELYFILCLPKKTNWTFDTEKTKNVSIQKGKKGFRT